jgi:ABC-type polar amino acid transport system ATPase subunit
MVLVTHEMRLASELADTVWSLAEGKLVGKGPPAEVLAGAEARLRGEP